MTEQRSNDNDFRRGTQTNAVGARHLPWLSQVCTAVTGSSVFPSSEITVETTESPIDVAGGIPDPTQLAYMELGDAVSQVLSDTTSAFPSLSYGDPRGERILREWIARFRGVHVDSVIVTNGAMEAIFLSAVATINPGDTILVEDRSFPQAIRIFSRLGAHVQPVRLTDQGIDTQELQRLLARQHTDGTTVKAIYTIPNFQNPTGVSATADVKQHLLDLAQQYGIAVIADDPYHDLWFSQPPAEFPDGCRGVTDSPLLEIGSFSKWLGPGLRVGWLIADPAVIQKVSGYRLGVDGGPATLTQYVLSRLLRGTWGQQRLACERRYYAEKATALTASLHEQLGDDISFSQPQGGYFLWARMPEWFHSQSTEARLALAQQNINPVWGDAFAVGGDSGTSLSARDAGQYLRLSFAHASGDNLLQVAGRLRAALDAAKPNV